MSKLPVISSKDLIKFLTARGFSYDYTSGDHHIYISQNGRISIPERQEMGKGLLLKILAETGISREEFLKWWNS